MARICLNISYEGGEFAGFQRQRGSQIRTIQSALDTALSRIACEFITTYCAGRTDRGVHAINQLIHFDTNSERPLAAWTRGVNALLPSAIRVQWASVVDDNFHARYSALSRRYIYLLYFHPQPLPHMQRHYVWQWQTLDLGAMQTAAQVLVGEHDFSAFRGADCQAKTPHRRIDHVEVRRGMGMTVIIDIQANAFLHHMVRNIVACLRDIGEGKQPIAWLKAVLASKSRQAASGCAPAHGLHLLSVAYPSQYNEINDNISFSSDNFMQLMAKEQR